MSVTFDTNVSTLLFDKNYNSFDKCPSLSRVVGEILRPVFFKDFIYCTYLTSLNEYIFAYKYNNGLVLALYGLQSNFLGAIRVGRNGEWNTEIIKDCIVQEIGSAIRSPGVSMYNIYEEYKKDCDLLTTIKVLTDVVKNNFEYKYSTSNTICSKKIIPPDYITDEQLLCVFNRSIELIGMYLSVLFYRCQRVLYISADITDDYIGLYSHIKLRYNYHIKQVFPIAYVFYYTDYNEEGIEPVKINETKLSKIRDKLKPTIFTISL